MSRPRPSFPWLHAAAPAAPPTAEPVTLAAAPVPRLALTARELAAALGVSASTVTGWARGEGGPPSVLLPGERLRRFTVDAVREWLQALQGRPAPPAEIKRRREGAEIRERQKRHLRKENPSHV